MSDLVTPDNFNRAETDMYFGVVVKEGGFGGFEHHRDVMPIDKQTVIRANRDTLYSSAIFDLDAGPVTVRLPDAGERFMSMQVIDEDQYVTVVVYGAGVYTFTRESVGTRYVMMALRTLVDPSDRADLAAVHALQDAVEVSQPRVGRFEVPRWDPNSQRKVRDALRALGETIPSSRGMFGGRRDVEPVRHLIGTAMAWGGNPEKDALYLSITPSRNDGVTMYRLVVRDVPVDGFWSLSVYNVKGYFEPNRFNIYTVNNITAKTSDDGSIAIQFGGCDGKRPNCLPVTPGWNYTVRMYRPRAEILDGRWTFPEAEVVR
jgi:hypothetical protein